MNVNETSRLCKTMLVAAALLSAPLAYAEPSSASPEMKQAFAKVEQGPDALRWYVQRTRMIYALNYQDVLDQYAKTRNAAAAEPTAVAQAPSRQDLRPGTAGSRRANPAGRA